MFYIHHTSCISPQETFRQVNIEHLHESVNNQLSVIEPSYEAIPPAILRRMGKAVRMGVGAALELTHSVRPDGIIIGTANGGIDDSIRFLNQLIRYEEGMLTPGHFVQSTANTVASQVAMLDANRNYNSTHVHRGLAFENAVMDADMLVNENPGKNYLLGGVDEISPSNYNIDRLSGWFSSEPTTSVNLYKDEHGVSMAGEGASMFLVNDTPHDAVAKLNAVSTLHTDNRERVSGHLNKFLETHLSPGENVDLFLTGENGDGRSLPFYTACESVVGAETAVARFKHMSGEYPTAAAMALWLACHIIQTSRLPAHMIKKHSRERNFKKILIYNNYRVMQHGFMLLSKAG